MLETVLTLGIFATTITAIGALYYKFGRLEAKVDFIYDNLKTVVSFKSNNNK